MATNNLDAAVAEHDAAADSSAPLPSFEERNHPSDPVNLIPETRRIRWTLNGPLEMAITVSRDIYFDPDEVLAAMSEDPGRTGAPFRSETRLFVIW